MFKKIAILAASVIMASSAMAAGPLTTTVKVNGGSAAINVDNATRVVMAGGAITVYAKGGQSRYYTDYAGGGKAALLASTDFKARFAQVNVNEWFNSSVGEVSCQYGNTTRVIYFIDNLQEDIADGCGGANAVKNSSAN